MVASRLMLSSVVCIKMLTYQKLTKFLLSKVKLEKVQSKQELEQVFLHSKTLSLTTAANMFQKVELLFWRQTFSTYSLHCVLHSFTTDQRVVGECLQTSCHFSNKLWMAKGGRFRCSSVYLFPIISPASSHYPTGHVTQIFHYQPVVAMGHWPVLGLCD